MATFRRDEYHELAKLKREILYLQQLQKFWKFTRSVWGLFVLQTIGGIEVSGTVITIILVSEL